MSIRIRTLAIFLAPVVVLVAAAYLEWAVAGMPPVPPGPPPTPATFASAQGFPAWLRVTHYVNFFFLILLVRSGLQILMDHPRLYWTVHSTPGTEWLRLTPIKTPPTADWTSKDDARSLSPWIGLPGSRHTVGMARHWHFLSVLFWIVNGLVFVVLLFPTGQWRRLVPNSWEIFPAAWAVFVHYVTFHPPPEPDGFVAYNALQQLTYFGVVFVLAPLAILTGPSMSPAFTGRFRWYPRLPGNRQVGRSLHFLVMCAFVAFLIAHVALVLLTGFARNMNHIVLGTDDTNPVGAVLGLVGIGVVVAANALAVWAAWRRPRLVQHAARLLVTPVMALLLNGAPPRSEFRRSQESPYFWLNGKLPTDPAWTTMAGTDFADYRLRVFGLVEQPVELSLSDLQAMGRKTQVTLHHCIQGWSGIAEWGGLPVATLLDRVRPTAAAHAVVFYSYGEGGEGGQFYDSLSIGDARLPQTILAYEMDGQALSLQHGAPLRLRVENQLGFKMVKWLQAIELVASESEVYGGEGGYNEDREYFGEVAYI